MKQIIKTVLALWLAFGTYAFAVSAQEVVLESANSLRVLTSSGAGIPEKLIQQAQAVVVIPKSVKVGFFFGVKYGEGVGSVKKADGSWSQPFFMQLGSGSLGLQLGFEAADSLLIFRTKNAVQELFSEKFTLGAGASIAAGPMGKNYERNAEVDLSAEIFSYSKTTGFFAGVSMEGAMLNHLENKNHALYGSKVTPQQIINMGNESDIYAVREFLQVLHSTFK